MSQDDPLALPPACSQRKPVPCPTVIRWGFFGALGVFVVSVTFIVIIEFVPAWLDPAHWRDLWYYATTDTQAAIQHIEQTYGIEIRHEITPEFFTTTQRESPENGTATQISDLEFSRSVRLLPSWFDKYPPNVLKFNLKALYFCQELRIYGAPAGGTYSYWDQRIYLSNNGRARGRSDASLEETFHHELSSLLMNNNFFQIQTWAAANPESVEYLNDPDKTLEALHNAAWSTRRSKELFEQGILRQYSLTNLENDFNEYAATVFTYPDQMKQVVTQYPVIKKKYLILKKFYLRLSPDFAPVFEKIL